MLDTDDPRLDAAPSHLDPRIHFALNCGARSCPPIRVYADEVDSQLEQATRTYLEAESELDRQRRRLTLPGLMRLYLGDFGGRRGAVEFGSRHLAGEAGDLLRANGGPLRVRFTRFDWRMEEVDALDDAG